ncbi:MAG: amino acid permease [Saprospiraceae bacterium]|jgi:APA family basic amino acid/polyamine antiporter|nr:amino acid permease [Saprospiraceae bacterium]MBP9209998.1 amino acid permease [Saprospiraceae bacterium]MBV6473252.1 Serine/threonine exchanger SteT [Saprospiraceae bacterium]
MKNKLTLTDAILIVSGSMIGSGIFKVSPDIARTVGGPGWLLAIWGIAGLITILGALSLGELAAMFPKAGGPYVFLKEAFSPLIGFLYGWTVFLVVQCGTIAAVAVAFASYFGELVPIFHEDHVLFSAGGWSFKSTQFLGIAVIGLLTFLNSQGLKYGKVIQRIFTFAKIFSLIGLIVLGIFVFGNWDIWLANWNQFWLLQPSYVQDDSGQFVLADLSGTVLLSAIGVALVGALFSCDAWNNVTFIAGEMEHPEKNLPRSLFWGVLLVVSLYILANVAYLFLLPFYGNPEGNDALSRGIQFAFDNRIGTAAAFMMFGQVATLIMALLIMVSTFGCNNGIIFASARVYQAMAIDGLFFDRMKDNNRNGVPGNALWIQFVWASLLCLSGKYGNLLDYVMFAVMLFAIVTIAGLFVLRVKQPNLPRPYRAFAYPFVPALYILLAGLFCLNLLFQKPEYTFPGLVIVALGIPVYYFWKHRSAAATQAP